MIAREGDRAAWRFIEFFTANIRNPNTRRAYARAVGDFFRWCEQRRVRDVAQISPTLVAAYVEHRSRTHAKPTVKQELAAVRMLFDWLVVGHVLDASPAHGVRGPKHVIKRGKTSVLTREETRELLDAIETEDIAGLRDRALGGPLFRTLATAPGRPLSLKPMRQADAAWRCRPAKTPAGLRRCAAPPSG